MIEGAAKIYTLLLAGVFIIFSSIVLFNPEDIRGVESNVIFSIQQILKDNKGLYQDPANAPYSVTQYSPLYYVLIDSALSIYDFDIGREFYEIRIVARTVSLLLSLTLVYLLYTLLVKEYYTDKQFSLSLCLLFLIVTYPWFHLSRPDVLVTLFLLLAINQTVKFLKTGELKYVVIGGCICAFAFFSKQNGIIILLGIAAFFIVSGKIKVTLFFSAGFIAGILSCSVVFFLLDYHSNFLFDNIVRGVNNGVSLENFHLKFLNNSISLYGFLIISSIVVSAATFNALKKDVVYQFLLFLSVTVLTFSIITALKQGSAEHYLLDWFTISLIMFGYVTTKIKSSGVRKLAIALSTWVVLIYSTSVMMLHVYRYHKDFVAASEMIAGIILPGEKESAENGIIAFLEAEIGEDYFYSPERSLRLRFPFNALFPQDEVVFGEQGLFAKKVFSYASLHKHVQSGQFKYYIDKEGIPPSFFGASLEDDFVFLIKIGALNVYKNKNNKF
ncbi:hypothetical protein D770_08280 [Flammeovirgaceae bacterium 311]|nr:hypothetical protein D770_08280 [Flammeovirgaceae bacterium 311]